MGAIGRAGLSVVGFVVLVFAAAPAFAGDADSVKCEDVKSIGVATMDADHVVTMWLRSLGPGPIAEGTFTYKPGDKDYDSTLAHLGGLKPGESKSVKPWC